MNASNPDKSLFTRLREAAQSKLAVAGLTAVASTGIADIAKAETGATKGKVTNVFALTGGLGGDLGPGTQVETHTFSIDEKNGTLTTNVKVNKGVGQEVINQMGHTGYFKIHFEGKDYIVQQEAVAGELHGYQIDSANNDSLDAKKDSDFIIKGLSTTGNNPMGTGDNQFIDIDGSGLIKTYELTKDATGKIDKKLIATSEEPLLKNSAVAVHENDLIAVNADLNTVFTMKKGKDGKWILDKKKEFPGEPGTVVADWDSTTENAVHIGKNGGFYLIIKTGENYERTLLDQNLKTVMSVEGISFMTLGRDGKYALLEEDGKYYIKKTEELNDPTKKGVQISIPNSLPDTFYSAQREGNGETTYYIKGEGEVVILNIKDGNLPVVSVKVLKQSNKVPFYRSELIVFNDKDQDGIYGGDNCAEVPNTNQADGDKNGVGDACDPNLWDMSWKKLPGVNAQLGCDDAASEPLVKPIAGGVELDFMGSGKIGLQPAGVSNESGNIQIRVAAGCSITIETSEGTVTKDGKAVSGKTTCASDTIFKVSPFATVKVTVVAGTAVTPDANPGSDATSGAADAKQEQDAGTPKTDAGSTNTGNPGADAGPSSADNGPGTGTTPKPDAAQQANTNGPSIGTPKGSPDGCRTSPIGADPLRTTGGAAVAAALIALRRKYRDSTQIEE